jgi:hypothetical protein
MNPVILSIKYSHENPTEKNTAILPTSTQLYEVAATVIILRIIMKSKEVIVVRKNGNSSFSYPQYLHIVI